MSRPLRYQIRVRGLLGPVLQRAFPALKARHEAGDTVLSGELADPAAVHGALTQIEALGLELVEVVRVGEPSESPGRVTAAHPCGQQPETSAEHEPVRRSGKK